jgi:hypothetical protein
MPKTSTKPNKNTTKTAPKPSTSKPSTSKKSFAELSMKAAGYALAAANAAKRSQK